MARRITGEDCRPEAIVHVAKLYHENNQGQRSLIAALTGFQPIPEAELIAGLRGQGITATEITLGIAAVTVAEAREAEEERQLQAQFADPLAWD